MADSNRCQAVGHVGENQELSEFALDLSTCVAPLFHLISFVSVKYTGVGGGGVLRYVFVGMCHPGVQRSTLF